jgi:hypothetical protein
MDILDRIVEAVAQKLISLRLNEEDESAGEKTSAANRDAAKKRYEAGMRASETDRHGVGPEEGEPVKHTRQNTVGRRQRSATDDTPSDAEDETAADKFASKYGRSGNKTSKPMPLDIKTKSKRGAPVNPTKVRGRAVNLSRSDTKAEARRLKTIKDVYAARKKQKS